MYHSSHRVHEPFHRGSMRQAAQPRGVCGFARRAPSRDQYDLGQHGRDFESQRYSGPCFPHRGDCRPPMRRGRVDVANPIVEQMARHWFSTHFANPSVEAFAHSPRF
jgi:hypothetical protein